jgi:hypothetical protein
MSTKAAIKTRKYTPLEIFGEKFFEPRQPAWEELGAVSRRNETVTQAAKRLPIPDVELEPARALGMSIPSRRVIVGTYVGDEEVQKKCYGIVSQHYKLLDHWTFLEVYEECIPAKVETVGLVDEGSRLYVTTRLPSFEVAGEEITNHLFAVNPVTGDTAVLVRPTGMRLICWNMMVRALSEQVSMEFVGRHMGSNMVLRLKSFLHSAWESQREKLHVMKEACDLLASTSSTAETEDAILDTVFPLPAYPENPSDEELERWEKNVVAQNLHREYTLLCAYESPNNQRITGTLWGLYQGGLEYEQHLRKGANARSALFGDGAKRAKRLFDTCLAFAQNNR